MEKFLKVVLAGMLVAGLVGCSGQDAENKEVAKEEPKTEQVEKQEVAEPEVAEPEVAEPEYLYQTYEDATKCAEAMLQDIKDAGVAIEEIEIYDDGYIKTYNYKVPCEVDPEERAMLDAGEIYYDEGHEYFTLEIKVDLVTNEIYSIKAESDNTSLVENSTIDEYEVIAGTIVKYFANEEKQAEFETVFNPQTGFTFDMYDEQDVNTPHYFTLDGTTIFEQGIDMLEMW